jgi:hypothetical protein
LSDTKPLSRTDMLQLRMYLVSLTGMAQFVVLIAFSKYLY